MKYLKSFKVFESLFRDIVNIDSFQEYTNNEFRDDVLIRNIYLKKYNKSMNIFWNHNDTHNIIEKIKNRTPLNSVNEFNEILKKVINVLFDNYLDLFDKQEKILNKYNMIFLIKTDFFNIIIKLNSQKIYDDNSTINIITILPKTTANVDFDIDLTNNENIY